MAYQTLDKSITTINGVPYQLDYEPQTGFVKVIQVNAPTGTQPIFENGRFSGTILDTPIPYFQQVEIYPTIQSKVRNAYNSGGGAGKNLKLQKWAELQNQGKAPGVVNTDPSNPVSGNNAGGGGSGSGGLWAAVTQSTEYIKSFDSEGKKFGYPGEKIEGDLIYPIDMKTNIQDHLVIQQYRYRAPNKESLFGGSATDNIARIGLIGLTRNSDFSAGKEKLMATVFLPMPNTVSDSNSVGWGGEGLNNISAALAAYAQSTGNMATLAAFGAVGGQAGAWAALLADLTKNNAIGPELTAQIGAMLQSKAIKRTGLQVSPETIFSRGAGIIPNNNLELLFNGPTLRSFSFQYRMTARSEGEATSIRKIIRSFKQGMAPKKLNSVSGAPSYFLGTPNIFRLNYRTTGNSDMLGVNRFKTCALQSFGCNYTPDGFWAAYDGGQPVSVIMQMQFAELEPIYDTDYQENNFSPGRDDLSVSPNSVGY